MNKKRLALYLAPLFAVATFLLAWQLLTGDAKMWMELLFNDPNLGSLLGILLIIGYLYWVVNLRWGDGKNGTNFLRLLFILLGVVAMYCTIPAVQFYTDKAVGGMMGLSDGLWRLANLNNLTRGIAILLVLGLIAIAVIGFLQTRYGKLGVALGAVILVLFGLSWANSTFHGFGAIPGQLEDIGAGGILIDPPR